MSEGSWRTLADGVFARRYAELDLTVGLVLGERHCLVIDTRGDEVQGAEFAAAVREITALPRIVVYTHAHFDHTFGTAAFAPREVWAHERCGTVLRDEAESYRRTWARRYRDTGRPDTAAAIEAARVVPPDRPVHDRAELDLGGRRVVLVHPGRGHTGHDLVVHLPGDGIVFTGDLVEHGAPPQFGDAHPQDWPGALDAVLALGAHTVVPGHGDPTTPGFGAAQRDELATVAYLARAVHTGELTEAEALARSPYPAEFTRPALRPG